MQLLKCLIIFSFLDSIHLALHCSFLSSDWYLVAHNDQVSSLGDPY